MNNDDKFVSNIEDPLVVFLNRIIEYSVKFLATLMVFVILWSLVDVVVHVYQQFSFYVQDVFSAETLFSTLGTFLAVLIAIEIFLNIIFYLKRDTINVTLVLATALTAISRKVIILDYTQVSTEHMYAMAGLILAVGLTYWLVTKRS